MALFWSTSTTLISQAHEKQGINSHSQSFHKAPLPTLPSPTVLVKPLKQPTNVSTFFQPWSYTQLFVGHHSSGRRIDLGTFAITIVFRGKSTENLDEDLSTSLYLATQGGLQANSKSFGLILRECTDTKALSEGQQVHAHVVKAGFHSDIFLGNELVNFYAKSRHVAEARQVFDKMPERNIVSWNAMIAGYSQNKRGIEALNLFCQMQSEGREPNQFTFSSALGVCTGLTCLDLGTQIQAYAIKTRFGLHVCVGNTLVDMYAKCGSIEGACKVFDKMHKRNVVSWNAMATGYAQHGQSDESLKLFCQMQRAGVKANQITFSSVLSASSSQAALVHGKQIHAHIIKTEYTYDIIVGNALITLYAKSGSLEDARGVFDKMPQRDIVTWTAMITGYMQHGCCKAATQLFEQMPERNVVSWNAMIAGYAQNGHGWKALNLFSQMQQTGIKLSQVTFTSVIHACASVAAVEHGKQIHGHIAKTGFESHLCVGSALADMYLKCWNVVDANKVFNKMPEHNVVSWTGMIAGYARNGCGEETLKLFCKMQQASVKPNQLTFTSVLGACGSLAAMKEGKQVHANIIKAGLDVDIGVRNAIVTMYAKCGSIKDAFEMFDRMPERAVVSWNAMIAGCAQHGLATAVLQLFNQMHQKGIKPNGITFIGVLSACSHGGLVDEGWKYFNSMSQDHGIAPIMDHYACMVDLLGRAGHLYEAENFKNKMPFEPSALVWRTLLGACRMHGNMELGKRVAEHILVREPQDPAMYVLLSNIYAAAGHWDDAEKVRKMMKERGVRKDPGCSWIEINNRVNTFVVSDKSHSQREEICRVGGVE